MQTIDPFEQQKKPPYPLIRVTTLGEFTLTRALPAQPGRPRYSLIPGDDIGSRGTAITMLKLLLCSPRRRMTKATLIENLWPMRKAINASHALDTTASVLRRHILFIPTEADVEQSLLQTQRINKETLFLLPPQSWLWVDADALLNLANTAVRKEKKGESPLPYLEAAHALDKGEFLEDEQQFTWTQSRRQTIDGARRRVLYHLVDLYIQEQRIREAEEMLFAFLQVAPEDEDALCRLLILLAGQGRRQEALNICQYSTSIIHSSKRELTLYTQDLGKRIQQGSIIYEMNQELALYTQDVSRHRQQGLIIREQQSRYRTIDNSIAAVIILVA
jgi:DNA-binding SARP family transcriptional activator